MATNQGPRRVRGGSSSSSSSSSSGSSDSDASKSSSSEQDGNGKRKGVGIGFAPLRGIKGLMGNIGLGRRKSGSNLRSSSSISNSDEMEEDVDKRSSHSQSQLSPQSSDYSAGMLPGVSYPDDNDEFEGLS